MAAFINLAADPVLYTVVEYRIVYDILLQDTLTRRCYAVFHYHRTAGSTPVLMPNLLGNLISTVGLPNLLPLLNVRVTGITHDLRPLDDPLIPAIENNAGTGPGQVTGDPLPSSLAVVCELRTDVRGRSFRGSKHFSGLSESDILHGDELDVTPLVNWNVFAAAMATSAGDGVGNTFTPCVLSPTLSIVYGTPPVFTGADLTGATAKAILGTMRRRKEKVPA